MLDGLIEKKCSDCQSVYMGDTAMYFSIVVTKHTKNYWRLGKSFSVFAHHSIKYNHSVNVGQPCILISENNFLMLFLEIVNRISQYSINTGTGIYNLLKIYWT